MITTRLCLVIGCNQRAYLAEIACFSHRRCRNCGGQYFAQDDVFSYYLSCLMCGHQIGLRKVSCLSCKASPKNKRISPAGLCVVCEKVVKLRYKSGRPPKKPVTVS